MPRFDYEFGQKDAQKQADTSSAVKSNHDTHRSSSLPGNAETEAWRIHWSGELCGKKKDRGGGHGENENKIENQRTTSMMHQATKQTGLVR